MENSRYIGVKSKLKKVGAVAQGGANEKEGGESQERPGELVLAVPDLVSEIFSHFDTSDPIDFRSAKNLGSINRALDARWRLLIRAIPQRCAAKMLDRHLLQFVEVEHLDLWMNTTVTDDSLKTLQKVTDLNLKGNLNVTDQGIAHMTKLRALNLSGVKHVGDETVKKFTSLTSLDLSLNDSITSEALECLTAITRLNLARNRKINGRSLAPVHLPELRSLNLTYNNHITDSEFRKLTQVKTVDLSGNTTISDSAVVSLMHTLDDFKGRRWLT